MPAPSSPEKVPASMTVEQHERQLQASGWPGVAVLARKWGVSRKTVRDIPRDQLPYISFGQSDVRRYDPDDVERFEAKAKKGIAA